MRFEDISNDEMRAYNAYRDDSALPIGIIREGLTNKKLHFKTLFDWLLPTAPEMTEIAKFMVEHDARTST